MELPIARAALVHRRGAWRRAVLRRSVSGTEFFLLGSSVVPSKFKSVELRFAAKTGFTDLNGNNQYDIGEPYAVPASSSQLGWFYRSLSPDSYTGFKAVPFTVWNVEVDPPRQLGVAVRDGDNNGQWDLHHQYSPGDPSFVNVNNGDLRFNYVFVLDVDYDPTGRAFDPSRGGKDLMLEMLMGKAPLQWVLWLDPRPGLEPYGAEDALALIPNRQVTSKDVFVFNPTELTTGIRNGQQPAVFVLEQNYPNPFNPATTIQFSLPADSHARVIIFDLLGRKVTTLVDERMAAGAHTITWSGESEQYERVASGVYLYRLEAAGEIKIRKMVLLR